jgi:signal transduction histidine kinase
VLLAFSVSVYELSEAALRHRVEAAVRSLADAAEVALRGETEEGESLQLVAQSTVVEVKVNLLPQEAIAVFGADGHVLAERGAPRAEQLRPALLTTASTGLSRTHHISVRSLALPGRRYEVVVSHALSSVDDDLAVLRHVLIGAVPAGVAIAGLAVWLLAQKALHPIRLMFGQQRQFMADASHELRTPVSVIVSAAEVVFGSAATSGGRVS